LSVNELQQARERMTDSAAKQKVGRRPRVEVVERTSFVRQSWTAHHGDRAKVHADFADFYGPTPERTIDSYIRKALDGFIQQTEKQAPDERRDFLSKLESDLALYAKSKAWGPHASARKLQARVLGLDVQTVDVRGGLTLTPGKPADEERPLSDAELDVAAELLAERERARLADSTNPRLPGAADDSTNPALPGDAS
jgi:hypothetical protein